MAPIGFAHASHCAPPRMHSSTVCRVVLSSLAASAPLLHADARAQAPDPFAPGLRWRAAATTQEAWIPHALVVTAGGELAWSVATGANPRLQLFDTSPFAAQLAPRLTRTLPGSLGVLALAAGRDGDALYALVQRPGPSPTNRWSEISRYDARAGDPSAPLWSRTLSMASNGVARIHAGRSSTELLATLYDQHTQRVALEWIDGADGSALSTYFADAPMLRQVATSRELERVALVLGAQAHVVTRTGQLEHVELLAAPTNALALSGVGAHLAVGSGGTVRVLTRSPNGWSVLREFSGGAGEVATRLALSDEGSTLAIGWWDSVVTQRVRFQLWRVDELAPRFERELSSSTTSLQNFPEVVALTPDGRRAAFGAWGTSDSGPEALLVDTASGAEVLALDLGGSVRALALDEAGTRLVVGTKHGHANQLGSTGEVRLFDTGERDVQLLAPPERAGVMHVAVRRSGSARAYLIRGPLAAVQTPFGSAAGGLWIARPLAKVSTRLTDASGRADFAVNVPSGGFAPQFALQAYFRGGAGAAFSSALAIPFVR